MKKFLSVLCVAVVLLNFAACSKPEQQKEDKKNHDEINKKYEELLNIGSVDTPIDSSGSVLGEDFSVVDFTFTSADDTVAFNLENNSFAKLNQGGTYFNFIAPGSEVMTFEPGFKTARGLTLQNTAGEFLEKYRIADSNALFVKPDDDVYYNPANGNFTGKLTAVYASTDSVSYSLLSSDDVQRFIYKREAIMSGAYMDPAKMMSEFSDYESIVSLDITADEAGTVSEVAFYKFDK